MEMKLNAPADKVFGPLTDPKWLEARSLAMGELRATCTASKRSGVQVTMERRMHRDMNVIIAKVLNPDSDIQIVESWSGDATFRKASYALTIVGKPVSVTPISNWRRRARHALTASGTRARSRCR